jgi:glycine dehydrogenase subunit 1
VLVAGSCHPDVRETLEAYATPQRYSVVTVPARDGLIAKRDLHEALGDDTAAVVLAFPNFFGLLEDLATLIKEVHKHGALAVVVFDPIAAGMLKRPGDFDADIVVGEGQALGIPLQYGAPYLGFMATRDAFLRRMPGRLVGVASDEAGRRGFALVLQTREQHIRRDKATSNVCTNQGLMAMRATVYMAAMGKKGLREAASLSFDKAHYAAGEIAKLPGYKLRFGAPFFKEFVVQSQRPVADVLKHCRAKGILAGVALSRWHKDMADCFTVAVTEKRTRQEIDALVKALKEI